MHSIWVPNIKKNQGTCVLSNPKISFFNILAWAGTDHICALRFTEGAKAPIDVFCPNCKMIGRARLELGQGTSHRQRKGLHLPNLLPVLLWCITVRVVLMEGIEMIAVYSRTCPISLCHTPGQHYTGLTWDQLQLRLLRRWGSLSLWR